MQVRPTSGGFGARSRTPLRYLLLGALLAAALALPATAAAADETFIVNSLVDGADDNPGDRICQIAPGGPCTLRAAAMEVSVGTYSSTELLAIELGPGEYRLTNGSSLNFTANAQVTVTGAGADQTTIRQTQPTRVLLHTGASALSLTDLTIRGGDVDGGNDSSLSGNGAGIYAIGDLFMEGVLVYENRTTPPTEDPSGFSAGGGAYLAGNFSIARTSFIENEAQSAGGVISVGSSGGQMANVLISENRAARNGGVEIQGAGTITDSAIRDNVSTDPLLSGSGGISLGRFGYQVIQRSEISGNRGRTGGIAVGGLARLENLTISGNETLPDTDGPAITLTSPFDGSIVMQHLTIADNTVPSGGAATAIEALSHASAAADPPVVSHSILDGNCDVPVIGGDQNVESGASCLPTPLGGGDLQGVDPQLGALSLNGGSTRTQVPAATSPAVDIALGDLQFFDQRRFTRPAAADDAGAVEREGSSVGELPAPPGRPSPDTPVDPGPAGPTGPSHVPEPPSGDRDRPPNPDNTVAAPAVKVAKRILVRGRELRAAVRVGAGEKIAVVSTAALIVAQRRRGRVTRTRTWLRPIRASARADERVILRHRFRGGKKKRRRLTGALKRKFARSKSVAKLRIRVVLTDEAGNSVVKKRVARVKVKRRGRGRN